MPYNPELVVGAMQELIREEATLEPNEDVEQELDLFQTPHKHLEVRQFARQLSDELDEAEISPGLRMKVRKFMKGSLARIEAGAQAEDDYSHTKVAENAQAAREKASSKVVQKGGVIYAEQARKRIKFREEGDAEADAKLLCLGNAKSNLFLISPSFALLQPVIESAGLKSKLIMGWDIR